MKTAFFLIACIGLCITSSAQNNFVIRGKVDLMSKSKSVLLGSGQEQFTAPINNDGSFEIKGKVTTIGNASIRTDSSAANVIWLEPGTYTVICKEVTVDGVSGYFLRIPRLKGTKDAEICYGFTEAFYSLVGKTKEETKKNYNDFALYYLDSIIRNFSRSKTIPQLLTTAQPIIGEEAVKVYRTLIDDGQKTDIYSNSLENYFKRKDKIEKEKVFNDFQMKAADGSMFKLSSLNNKKLILIDFWSSDCAPCRRKHLELVDIYNKYSSKGLEIVSVSLDYNDNEWRKAMLKDKMSWVSVSELKGWKTSLAEDYFVNSIPFSLWLDKDRKVIKNEMTEKEIEEFLRQ